MGKLVHQTGPRDSSTPRCTDPRSSRQEHNNRVDFSLFLLSERTAQYPILTANTCRAKDPFHLPWRFARQGHEKSSPKRRIDFMKKICENFGAFHARCHGCFCSNSTAHKGGAAIYNHAAVMHVGYVPPILCQPHWNSCPAVCEHERGNGQWCTE